jgi:tRNA(Arg) A34 adenosine deaminase TadA
MEKISRRTALLTGAATLLSANSASKVLATNKRAFADLDHEYFMRLAITQGKKVPKCPFGSVIVNIKTKQVVAEGWVRADKSPIWHGEMTAIYNCPDADKGFNWSDVCLYTTGESCPMCQSAIVWSKMPLVVYGSPIPFLQSCGFGQINIRAQTIVDAAVLGYGDCTIIGDVLRKECDPLFINAKELNALDVSALTKR